MKYLALILLALTGCSYISVLKYRNASAVRSMEILKEQDVKVSITETNGSDIKVETK